MDGVPKKLLDNDKIFSSALQRTGVITSVYLSKSDMQKEHCKEFNGLDIETLKFDLLEYEYLLCNTAALGSKKHRSGFVNTYLDEDAVLRRMPVLKRYKEQYVPALSLATLLSIDESVTFDEVGTMSFLSKTIQLDKQSNFLLRFYHDGWYKKISASDFLEGRVAKDSLQGKIVLIGSSAVSLHDQLIVTGGKKMAGVKVHVTMMDNILDEEYMVQPEIYKMINILLSLVLSFLLFFLLYKKYKKSLFVLFFGTIVSFVSFTSFSFVHGVYLSAGYFFIPFVTYFFLVSVFYILIDSYDRFLFEKALTQKHIDELEDKVKERTAQLVASHKHIEDNINYASYIQSAILPQEEILKKYAKDFFVIWQPRDVVGGDIYCVSELNSGDEVIIMVIDGVGHGVSGAFVTMLVKAIEAQIIANIDNQKMQPSPAIILEYFNKSIKSMLKQEKRSKANAGFDGGVLYYNKKTKACKFAGAKSALITLYDNKVEVIDGDRKNVGFARVKADQKYTDHEVTVKDGLKFYMLTDGLVDQESPEGKRFSKQKFLDFLVTIHKKIFERQKDDILSLLENHQKNLQQSDDITVFGIEFK